MLEVYFINTMGIEINKQIIKNVVATSYGETFELLDMSFALYLFASILFIYILHKFAISEFKRIRIIRYVINTFLLITIFFGLTKINNTVYRKFIKHDTPKVSPINFFPAMERYINTKARDEKIIKKSISDKFTYTKRSTKPIISVMVLGESTRGDRFGINGYSKNTTPHLSKNQNIISFTNASSCDTSTLSSIPCMMLRYTKDQFEFPINETSFVEVFKDKGFDTYWLTIQDEAPGIKTFCEEASQCIDMKDKKYDMDMLDKFNEIVSKVTKDTLIVLHTMGSHYDYNERVPDQYKKFQPIYTANYTQDKQKLDNSYDNTVFYIDAFLNNIITSLKDKNAFLLFSSDHGESLGEKQYGVFAKFGHAAPYDIAPFEQTNVPFILWFSTDFRNNKQNISNISPINKKLISHDYIFSTMLGCAGFDGDYINQELNICHESF
jgi:glucan phosphoethanolaminetransferase (alkaline phosphatase superfamily)